MTARAKLTKVEPAAPETERPPPTVTLTLNEVGRLFGVNDLINSPLELARFGLERLSRDVWLLVSVMELNIGDEQTLAGQLAERIEQFANVMYEFEKAEREEKEAQS